MKNREKNTKKVLKPRETPRSPRFPFTGPVVTQLLCLRVRFKPPVRRFSQDLYPNSETVHKERTVLDTSLHPYAMNLFNLLPTAPQETRHLYYETGAAKDFPRIGTVDTPYIESFDEMMARVQEETKPSERGASPDAGSAESGKPGTGTDYTDYGEKTGRADDQRDPVEKPPVAEERGGTEKPRVEAEELDKKKRSSEEIFVGDPSLGMAAVRPDSNADQAAVEAIPEKAGDDTVTPGGKSGGTTATDRASPDVKAAFSPEDGITFTDTYPLFDNTPDIRGAGFDDDAPAPGLMQDEGIMLANGEETAEAARQYDTTRDGLKGDVSKRDEIPEPEENRPGSFQSPLESEAGHQFVSLANTANTANNAGNGAKPENEASKKKADARKLTVEVADMRSDAGKNVRGGALVEDGGAKPLSDKDITKEITVDLNGALLGSLGDGRQTPVSFDQFGQFDNAAAKSAAQLESFLSRELHNGLNGDIVRQAAVMLRDGGEGLIRLQLHPESLGNVRIRLALSGNRVEGIITVESPEAMNAFERELESLEMAFRDSGFEGASLNMQMSGGKTGTGLFDGIQAGAFSQVIAASSYESSTVTAGESARSIYDHGGLSILA
jgi:hypothetical protein